MKLIIDMNLSPLWVTVLRDAGFEADHWSEIGDIRAPDTVIMGWAKVNDRVVITHDLDFSAILAATGGGKPSVVQIRSESLSPNVIGLQVIAALRQMTSELDVGALISIDTSRTRLRVLPLRPIGAPR